MYDDPFDLARWKEEQAADERARLTPPDPLAPLDIPCERCKCTVRLKVTQTLKSAVVREGRCVCGLRYNRQEPMVVAVPA